MNVKTHYLKKENLAKNLLQSILSPEDLKNLDWAIRMTYQANDKQFKKYKDRMKKLKELYEEL